VIGDPFRTELIAVAEALAAARPLKERKGWRATWTFFVLGYGRHLREDVGMSFGDPFNAAMGEDIQKVTTFMSNELGDAPGALAQRTPPHMDLTEVLQTRSGLDAAKVKAAITFGEQTRGLYVAKILMRAFATEAELWDQRQIQADVARELLDRRLRLVEQMSYRVNTPGGLIATTWKLPGAGQWTDGYLTRLFEYPFIANELAVALERAEAAGVSLSTEEGTGLEPYRQTGAAGDWDWLKLIDDKGVVDRYMWDRPPPHPEARGAEDPDKFKGPQALVNVRLPTPQLRSSWKVSPNDMHTLRWFGGPTVSLVEAIDAMFANGAGAMADKENYWNRAWMYCDHVIAALQIEALLFARRRRKGLAAGNSEIAQLGNRPAGAGAKHSTFVWLGPMVLEDSRSSTTNPSAGLLDGRRGNTFFRTRLQSIDELQIGDHVIFWNSAIYDVLTGGAMRLENATVVDLASKADGTLDRGKLWLAGHAMLYALDGYLKEFMKTIDELLKQARALIRSKLSTPNLNQVQLPNRHRVIRWAPYTGLSTGETVGPWWLVYPLQTVPGSPFEPIAEKVDDAVLFVPGAIGVRAGTGGGRAQIVTATTPRPGRNEVPKVVTFPVAAGGTAATTFTPFWDVHTGMDPTKNILFPLVMPSVGKGDQQLARWPRYLKRRETEQVNPTLIDLAVDSTMIPGIVDPNGMVWTTSPKPLVT
jgi:hypothetical protein